MAFDAGAIVGALILETGQYVAAINKSAAEASQFAHNIERDMGGATEDIASKGASAAEATGAAVAGAMAVIVLAAEAAYHALKKVYEVISDIFKEVTDRQDDMRDTAAAIGTTTEALSAWGLAAQEAGSNTEAVAQAMQFLGRNAADAAHGNADLLVAFHRLGIENDDLQAGLNDIPGLMLKVADGLQALPTAADRSAVAMQALGRGGKEILPFLIQGSDVISEAIDWHTKYGAVVTTQQGIAADAWNDAINRISSAWEKFKSLLIEPIREALMPYLDALLSWWEQNQPIMVDLAMQIGKVIGDVARIIIDVAALLLPILAAISSGIGQFFSSIGSATGIKLFQEMGQAAIDLSDALHGLSDSLGSLNEAAGFVTGGAGGGFGGGGGGGSAAANSRQVNEWNLVVNANVDTAQASDEISRKLAPAIRDAARKQHSIFTAHAQVDRVKQGLGG